MLASGIVPTLAPQVNTPTQYPPLRGPRRKRIPPTPRLWSSCPRPYREYRGAQQFFVVYPSFYRQDGGEPHLALRRGHHIAQPLPVFLLEDFADGLVLVVDSLPVGWFADAKGDVDAIGRAASSMPAAALLS